MRTDKIVHYLSLLFLAYSHLSYAIHQHNDVVDVSNGPFTKELVLKTPQNDFSSWWKENVEVELSKPVNFAGKYRLFVSQGGHGKECPHDYWICGWVIDKTTGEVVATLPTSPEGGNCYAEFVDNGTSDGLKFKVIAYADRTSLTIIGRAVNAPLRDADGEFLVPECRTIKYNFDGKNYTILKEDDNGCNLRKEVEVYGK
ncbi:hypothetical protein NOE29_05520 [Escherichia coli]|nr:hypothetical protein [Escherichia coli]MCQ1632236.1 hypothetical protein [Escherichia coli]MEB7742092.1 hypothetical protein [Escherichia coli]